MIKEEARKQIAELLSKYEHLSLSEIKSYHEAKTKQGFVLPLFQYLGWDIFNTDEVAPEEKASKGRVDYAFKLRGISQFYLEAKPLKADLNKPEYKEQVITYAYNKGVTWAVLTDFEGVQVFNAQTGQRFLNLNHENYITDFDKLWLLSRESLQSGLLNKEAATYGALPPTVTIEKRLYDQLRQWREELFTQLHHYNPGLSFGQIDEVIQRFFNRLIFIRTCEDRGIEEKVLLSAVNQWRTSGCKGELVEAIGEIFRRFDGYYDSDLFLLHPVDQVYIESPTIEHTITGLYEILGGVATYDFSVIDADVLGAVYEQYLGHVATIVKQREKEAQTRMDLGFTLEPTIQITAKKQRRKEHGIYYTPKFITNYIVKETVGRFLQEHSYEEILNLKVLDPACGSGSFLIRAYDELLTYHADKRGKPIFELDQWERLPILTNNIFGVDLDMQAIEIARLNLLLRSLAKRETLPSLTDNIRQGNSLISGAEQELKGYFGDNWGEKKPFNWEQEFKDIMADGGFDVVIGNPPYALLQPQNVPERELRFIHDHYLSAQYKVDTFHLFLERGVSLLAEEGKLGFIVPNTFLMNIYTSNLRKLILDTCKILEIVIIPRQVFPEAEVDNAILILQKESDATKRSENEIEYKTSTEDVQLSAISASLQSEGTVRQRAFSTQPDYFFNISLGSTLHSTFTKADESSWVLGELARVHFGLQTRDRRHYPDDVVVTTDRSRIVMPYQPCLTGKDIQRYAIYFGNRYVYFDESIRAGGCWDKAMHLADEKIIIRQIGEYPIAAFDDEGYCCLNTVFMVKSRTPYLDLRYVLGIINSQFIRAYWREHFFDQKVLFPKIKGTHLKQLPVRRIDFDNPNEKKMHDDLVALVSKMLQLNKKLEALPHFEAEQRRAVEKEIEHTDRAIDSLVYKLYGLAEDEIKIIESQAS